MPWPKEPLLDPVMVHMTQVVVRDAEITNVQCWTVHLWRNPGGCPSTFDCVSEAHVSWSEFCEREEDRQLVIGGIIISLLRRHCYRHLWQLKICEEARRH